MDPGDAVFVVTLFSDSDRRLLARVRSVDHPLGSHRLWTLAGADEVQRLVGELIDEYALRTGTA